MAKCKICPLCGASLDYGELCDCEEMVPDSTFKATSPPVKRVYGEVLKTAQLPSPGNFVPAETVQEYLSKAGSGIYTARPDRLVQVMPTFPEGCSPGGDIKPLYITFVRVGPFWQFAGRCQWGDLAARDERGEKITSFI